MVVGCMFRCFVGLGWGSAYYRRYLFKKLTGTALFLETGSAERSFQKDGNDSMSQSGDQVP